MTKWSDIQRRIRHAFEPQAESLRTGWSSRADDARAGAVVGLEALPDGMATGSLAGVNPMAGVYGAVLGFATAAIFSRTSFMVVQPTGAMALMVADHGVGGAGELALLTILTGLIMFAAGTLGLSSLLRFVPTAVMVGFVNAVGVSIILSQIGDMLGRDPTGANRLLKLVDSLLHLNEAHLPSLLIGLSSIALILLLRRTKLGALGLIAAVVVASALGRVIDPDGDIAKISDIADVSGLLPRPVLPGFNESPDLIVAAISLALVGLLQGSGVSDGLPEPDRSQPSPSRDFTAQGLANVAAGFFRGMPVGGSMSGSVLAVESGGQSRWVGIWASVIMLSALLLFSDLIGYVAIPALAGLMMVVGVESLRPEQMRRTFANGQSDQLLMVLTFMLCIVMPVQYAVLIGVAVGMVWLVQYQAFQLRLNQLLVSDDGKLAEVDAPPTIEASKAVILQLRGRLFFGSAPALQEHLPEVNDDSQHSVVILRLRGEDPIGFSACDTLSRYAESLRSVDSRLMLVADVPDTLQQFDLTGLSEDIGEDNIYRGNRWIGDATHRALDEATSWIESQSPNPPAAEDPPATSDKG